MRKLNKIFVIYGTAVSLFIFISGLTSAKNNDGFFSMFFFLPVVLYFLSASFRILKSQGPQIISEDKKVSIVVALLVLILLIGVGISNFVTHKESKKEEIKPNSEPIIINTKDID